MFPSHHSALHGVLHCCEGVDALHYQTHTFARDLRTWQTLREAMSDNEAKLHKVSKRVKGLLDRLLTLGGNTKKSVRGRLKDVEEELDGLAPT